MFSFGLTWSAYTWLVKAGILKTFYIIASIQIGICLLSIPMCKLISLLRFKAALLLTVGLSRYPRQEKQVFLQSA